MRKRLSLLLVTLAVAVVAVACGRASKQDIDAALGITPSATLSVAQVATGTANAANAAQTRTAARAALSSPGAGGSPVSLAALGDVTAGQRSFNTYCSRCHRPAGNGPAAALAGPNNPATKYTDEQLQALVRTGVGHTKPPGPLTTVTIPDSSLINIIAYIRDQSQ